MADTASSPATLGPNHQPPEPGAPKSLPNQSHPAPAPPSTQSQSSTPVMANPDSNPPLTSAALPPPPPLSVSYAAAGPPQISGVATAVPHPSMPSFRPLLSQAPHFSPLPNPSAAPNLTYQNPAVPRPGVASGAVAVPVSVPPMQPMTSYQVPPGRPANPALPPFANGYAAAPLGTVPPAVS